MSRYYYGNNNYARNISYNNKVFRLWFSTNSANYHDNNNYKNYIVSKDPQIHYFRVSRGAFHLTTILKAINDYLDELLFFIQCNDLVSEYNVDASHQISNLVSQYKSYKNKKQVMSYNQNNDNNNMQQLHSALLQEYETLLWKYYISMMLNVILIGLVLFMYFVIF